MNKNRLLQLASFLETLKHNEFDLGIVRIEEDCETTGCGIGWCPDAFPNHVFYDRHKAFSRSIKFPSGAGMFGAMEFFGLMEEEFHFLFTPGAYEYAIDVEGSDTFVIAEDLTGRIRRFVADELSEEDQLDMSALKQETNLLEWRW